MNSNTNDIFIDPEEGLNNKLNQNDFMGNSPQPLNYNIQPLRELPYLKDHPNINSLSNNILNNDELPLIDKSKEIKLKEVFVNKPDSFPSKNEPNENNNNSQKASLYGDKPRNKHTKFSDDNIRRKCKCIILNYVKEFINKKLRQIYNNNIGNGIMKKKILDINKQQVAITNIDYNQKFIKKTIGTILSDTISTRFTNYRPKHNEELIKRLKEDENKNIREYFEKLFNLTFLDCVDHFIGNEKLEILEGMTLFEEMKDDHAQLEKRNIDLNDESYLENLKYYFENYESILKAKKSRNRKTK